MWQTAADRNKNQTFASALKVSSSMQPGWTSLVMCCLCIQKLFVTFFLSCAKSPPTPWACTPSQSDAAALKKEKKRKLSPFTIIADHMDKPSHPVPQFEVDVDLGFALFFLFLLCFFLLVTVVRCAQTVVDPYGSISTSTYQEEQITWDGEREKGWGESAILPLCGCILLRSCGL